MKNVTIDYGNVLKFVPEKEILSYEESCNEAVNKLLNKTGKGNDFVGWVNYPTEISEDEIARIKAAKNKIYKNGTCLVVVGIGGSYLGAKAVIEWFLTPLC